jgi:hypothetical protein
VKSGDMNLFPCSFNSALPRIGTGGIRLGTAVDARAKHASLAGRIAAGMFTHGSIHASESSCLNVSHVLS